MTRRSDRRYAKTNGRGYSGRTSEVYHPPGPGIGMRPGPAPALGRPGILPSDHGAWKNDSCYSRGSKGWKPDILSIGNAHSCPGEKGPQSPFRPPNISQSRAGYNTKMFSSESDVARALNYIGYQSPDGNSMLRSFQSDWNRVVVAIAQHSNLEFVYAPKGDLQTDGDIGPHSLNAIEVAIINQRIANIPWVNVVEYATSPGHSNVHGRRKIYNAAQGM